MKDTVVYALIPIVCALIGWLTNFIAVRMIFRPRRPVRILGIRIQGLVPMRQSELARKIGETVETKLLTHDDIHAALKDPELREEIETSIAEQVDRFFDEKLGSNPLVGMFLKGDTAKQIKATLARELAASSEDFIDSFMEKAQKKMQLRAIVQKKIEEFDLSTLEAIVHDIASKELKLIEVVGGVLGFLVGLGQVGLLLLTR